MASATSWTLWVSAIHACPALKTLASSFNAFSVVTWQWANTMLAATLKAASWQGAPALVACTGARFAKAVAMAILAKLMEARATLDVAHIPIKGARALAGASLQVARAVA